MLRSPSVSIAQQKFQIYPFPPTFWQPFADLPIDDWKNVRVTFLNGITALFKKIGAESFFVVSGFRLLKSRIKTRPHAALDFCRKHDVPNFIPQTVNYFLEKNWFKDNFFFFRHHCRNCKKGGWVFFVRPTSGFWNRLDSGCTSYVPQTVNYFCEKTGLKAFFSFFKKLEPKATKKVGSGHKHSAPGTLGFSKLVQREQFTYQFYRGS